jgi:hypothetical protein
MTKDSKGQKRKPVRALKPGSSKSSWRRQQREAYLAKWRSWDWSKQDVELAREMGLSRERIRQIRQLLGAPRSPHHGCLPATHRHNTLVALQWAIENLDRLKGLSGRELTRQYGFLPCSPVYEFLRTKGVLRNGNYKHRWDLMNWELPSLVLERVWELPFHSAADYRFRKRPARPKWTLFGGLAALQGRGELRAYNRAVQAEERKAAKYFAESGRL